MSWQLIPISDTNSTDISAWFSRRINQFEVDSGHY